MASTYRDRLTVRDRTLWCELETRTGTFSADELARDLGLPWEYVRDSLLALLSAGRLFRAADGLTRYTKDEALRRPTTTRRISPRAIPVKREGCERVSMRKVAR